jgi:hypothetical protein
MNIVHLRRLCCCVCSAGLFLSSARESGRRLEPEYPAQQPQMVHRHPGLSSYGAVRQSLASAQRGDGLYLKRERQSAYPQVNVGMGICMPGSPDGPAFPPHQPQYSSQLYEPARREQPAFSHGVAQSTVRQRGYGSVTNPSHTIRASGSIRMESPKAMHPMEKASITSATSRQWGIVTLLSKKAKSLKRIQGHRRKPVRAAGPGAYSVAIQILTEQSENRTVLPIWRRCLRNVNYLAV